MNERRKQLFTEMKSALGLVEGEAGSAGSISPNWLGYAMPNDAMVHMRQGGPTIGGPGFANNQKAGGVYNLRRSPGLGFKTEAAWKVWQKAIDLMSSNPTMPQGQILMTAFQRASIRMGQLDPAEIRLLEMGVQWYLSDPVPPESKRGTGMGTFGGGGPTSGERFTSGPGAPTGAV